MWNDKKSLVLSKICVILFMAALVGCAIYAPSALDLVVKEVRMYFVITLYAGCVPAALLLVCLYALLHRIGSGSVFVSRNVDCLRHISWCSFAGAAISLVSASYWFPWFAVSVAAAFMGLIARVIKNVLAKAVSLQDDADYTI